MPRKRRIRRRGVGTRAPILVEARVNARWSLDFVHDQLAGGGRFRILNVVDDVTRECINSDSKMHGMVGIVLIRLDHCGLDFDRTGDRVQHAGELGQDAVAGGVRNPSAVLDDQNIDHCAACRERRHGRLFVAVHQAAVAFHVSCNDRPNRRSRSGASIAFALFALARKKKI
jgi:hypothetical protein